MLPSYFFDIDDGKRHLRDERGRNFQDYVAAIREAKDILIAVKAVQGFERRTEVVFIKVRDQSGTPIFEGSI